MFRARCRYPEFLGVKRAAHRAFKEWRQRVRLVLRVIVKLFAVHFLYGSPSDNPGAKVHVKLGEKAIYFVCSAKVHLIARIEKGVGASSVLSS